jgi:hypothetical protein
MSPTRSAPQVSPKRALVRVRELPLPLLCASCTPEMPALAMTSQWPPHLTPIRGWTRCQYLPIASWHNLSKRWFVNCRLEVVFSFRFIDNVCLNQKGQPFNTDVAPIRPRNTASGTIFHFRVFLRRRLKNGAVASVKEPRRFNICDV